MKRLPLFMMAMAIGGCVAQTAPASSEKPRLPVVAVTKYDTVLSVYHDTRVICVLAENLHTGAYSYERPVSISCVPF